MGQKILLWSKRWFEGAGFEVLYGDTDSLFVRSALADAERADARARELVASLNIDLARYVADEWRVESRLELQFAKLYLRLFLRAPDTAPAGPPSATRASCTARGRRRCQEGR